MGLKNPLHFGSATCYTCQNENYRLRKSGGEIKIYSEERNSKNYVPDLRWRHLTESEWQSVFPTRGLRPFIKFFRLFTPFLIASQFTFVYQRLEKRVECFLPLLDIIDKTVLGVLRNYFISSWRSNKQTAEYSNFGVLSVTLFFFITFPASRSKWSHKETEGRWKKKFN